MPMMRRMGRPGLIGMAARTAVVAGTATAVSGNVARRQQGRADQKAEAQQYEMEQQQAAMAPPPQYAEPAPAAPAAPEDPTIAKLQQLAALHSQGILTDEEFSAAKAKALG
ncbi:MAG: SHOCT domain-containing protein [Leifsonia sp.]